MEVERDRVARAAQVAQHRDALLVGAVRVTGDDDVAARRDLGFGQAGLVNDTTVVENAGPAIFQVRLSADPSTTVAVHYATLANGSAGPGDFQPVSGDLTFLHGEALVQSVAVPILDDGEAEVSETFSLVLSNPVNATLADRDKIATALRQTKDYQAIVGKITFDDFGQNINPTTTKYVVQDGKFIDWDKSEYATGKRKPKGR